MLKKHYEIARKTFILYHEDRIMSYTDIMNGIKRYLSDYPDNYELIGDLVLDDSAEILATRDRDIGVLSLDDMYILPTSTILKFWEKYATPDEICKNIIQWYLETYHMGYTLIFK